MQEKDVGMRIRVERELRNEFLSLCREQDRPAAQVIREFMREFIAAKKPHRSGQADQFRKTPAVPRGRE